MMHRFFDPRSVAKKKLQRCLLCDSDKYAPYRTKKRYTASMEKEHFISIIKNSVLSFSVVGFFSSFVTLVFFTILDFFGVLSSSLLLSLPIIFIIFSFIAIWLNKIYWEFMNEIKKYEAGFGAVKGNGCQIENEFIDSSMLILILIIGFTTFQSKSFQSD